MLCDGETRHGLSLWHEGLLSEGHSMANLLTAITALKISVESPLLAVISEATLPVSQNRTLAAMRKDRQRGLEADFRYNCANGCFRQH